MRTSDFATRALDAIEASEGRRRRRKRDTTPDRIGLDLKRDLLARLAADDPPADEIDRWLLDRTMESPSPGATRAMCGEILLEYNAAIASPTYRRWLESGAPSDDREDQVMCSAEPTPSGATPTPAR